MAAAAIGVSPTPNGVVPAPETDSVFKPALLLMSGRTVAFAATFFIPLVLARIFDPAQFGTYKQLFLIWGTVYYIAQVGMASSLYYFLPRAPRMAGSYVANSLLFLAAAGLVCLGALVVAAPNLGRWLRNVTRRPCSPVGSMLSTLTAYVTRITADVIPHACPLLVALMVTE